MSRSIAPLIVCCVVACAEAKPSPRAPAECSARIERRIARPTKSESHWQHYELPASWTSERRAMVIAFVLDSVGKRVVRDGIIDQVVIDHESGAIDAHADVHGHEELVRLFGGCVLYSDPPCEDCVVEVVPLEHARAEVVQRAIAALPHLEVRSTADVATNSVVLTGRTQHTAKARALVEVLDCQAE